MARAREVGHDTIDDACEYRLNVESSLCPCHFIFLFIDLFALLKLLLAFVALSRVHLMVSKSLTADLNMFVLFLLEQIKIDSLGC